MAATEENAATISTRPGEPLAVPEDIPLTDRQRQVLVRLIAGVTNHQIARALGISEKTVEKHLSTLYARLGVRCRAAAAVSAANHGLHEDAVGESPIDAADELP
jgi:DNA-binding NarL/FixJ family response regulator